MTLFFIVREWILSLKEWFFPVGVYLLSGAFWAAAVTSVILFRLKKKNWAYILFSLAAIFLTLFSEFEEGLFRLAVCFFIFALSGTIKKRDKQKVKVSPAEKIQAEIRRERGFSAEKVVVDSPFKEEKYTLDEERIPVSKVIAIAEKLRKAKLSVADRLETENIYKELRFLSAKGRLTAEEDGILGDYLSTLLKLSVKYSVS